MKKIFLILLIGIMMSACASNPEPQKSIVMIINGAEQVVDLTKPHPCEGNWNFCEYNWKGDRVW